jgi:hypothetical protein
LCRAYSFAYFIYFLGEIKVEELFKQELFRFSHIGSRTIKHNKRHVSVDGSIFTGKEPVDDFNIAEWTACGSDKEHTGFHCFNDSVFCALG